ncbi:MAG: fumarate reductase flavoprotein subunit [Pseudomonadales bacterium]
MITLVPSIAPSPSTGFDIQTGTLIIGAGACGLVAALAAHECGQEVLVIEADTLPAGSTALSAGLIPAAGTSLQINAGIQDSAELFATDIQSKAKHENSIDLVEKLAGESAAVIEWLMGKYDFPFTLVNEFDYPGHSVRRMHGLPSRSGRELVDALRAACERVGIDILCDRRAVILHTQELVVTGASICNSHDLSEIEAIGCEKLILACNGFGGNRDMVSSLTPEIEHGLWFGHSGNQGEAIKWGEGLGAALKHLGAYQGHGNVASPHGILITWAVITAGGVQLNKNGVRFWDESQGYSEAARQVLSQPEGVAVAIFDARIAAIARQFEDFKQAEYMGAIVVSDSLDELARHMGLPPDEVISTLVNLPSNGVDEFGRNFSEPSLQAPYYAVKVTGALFHTQGGLMIDSTARVRHTNGAVFPNLFAGGGAACGVSGSGDSGYLSGNGLLSAVVLGYAAGIAAVK